MRNLWYFGLEPVKSRYTYQLSNEWMPDTFKDSTLNFIPVNGDYDKSEEIKVGAVLDATGRGKFALSQCANFLTQIEQGKVQNDDIIFLQDYWTSGIDSIFYALDLYNIDVKVYGMLHAQSVDEYDFTYPMRYWMRDYELGLDKRMSGIFVGSTIHKEQLREAGFNAPIHVVSLPFHKEKTLAKLPNSEQLPKENKVVFSSRLDKEKNPYFMLEVAEKFLEQNLNWVWHVTTSGKEFRSSLPGLIEDMKSLAERQPRFKLMAGLTKEEYYTELSTCRIQFNSSLQDYVSWTVIESTAFGADIVFPDYRSFPEFIPKDNLYKPFDVNNAIKVLTERSQTSNFDFNYISDLSDLGRRTERLIIESDMEQELNVWHESKLIEKMIVNYNKR